MDQAKSGIFVDLTAIRQTQSEKKNQTKQKNEKSQTGLQLQSFLWLTYINIEKDVTRLFESSDIKKVWA